MAERGISPFLDQHSCPEAARVVAENVQLKDLPASLRSTPTAEEKKTHVSIFKAKYGSLGSGLDAGLGSSCSVSSGDTREDRVDGTPGTPAQTATYYCKVEQIPDSLGGLSGPQAAKEAFLGSVSLRPGSALQRSAALEGPAKARAATPVPPENLGGGSRLDPVLRDDLPFPRCDGVLRSGSPYPRPSLLRTKDPVPVRRPIVSFSQEPFDVDADAVAAAGVSRSSSLSSVIVPSCDRHAEGREKMERLHHQVERPWQHGRRRPWQQPQRRHHQQQQQQAAGSPRTSSVGKGSQPPASLSSHRSQRAQRPLESSNANEVDVLVLAVLFVLFLLFLFANNIVSLFSHSDSRSNRDFGLF